MLICALVSCGDEKKSTYENALALLEKGEYEEAKAAFEKLGDYKDAKEYLKHFHYFVSGVQAEGLTLKVSFNEKNLPSQCVITNGGGGNAIISVTYDKKGNVTKQTETDYDGDKSITDYTYRLVYIPFDLPEATEELIDSLFGIY